MLPCTGCTGPCQLNGIGVDGLIQNGYIIIPASDWSSYGTVCCDGDQEICYKICPPLNSKYCHLTNNNQWKLVDYQRQLVDCTEIFIAQYTVLRSKLISVGILFSSFNCSNDCAWWNCVGEGGGS